ncbi:AAA family ATPase [uncultured Microbacterium sp.]|uniref:AAA family ATPase n=1 Tax=uncultured Microbacterium sp. TaxID=191216 RepID=UPI0025E81C60|nr:AAA family ATPase [uncultured Microbacterium sp.]
MTRYTVEGGAIREDELSRAELMAWVDGRDPVSGDRRGRELLSPQADLILDGTINAPKSFSIVALVHPDLSREFEALQDRLRYRIITTWQQELNARRGAGGRIRQAIHRLEVVELQHRRSRALDPHIHRHLWLSVKVQGIDGHWSNVDSRVAMRLHTLINAEGDLAARTDPEWVAALARHGYTLNAGGEIAQVARAVRPLSRRSNQIEAHRAVALAEWRDRHPGQEPDRDVLQQIDRLAWATGRPGRPTNLAEDTWERLVRDELAAIDSALLCDGNATGRVVPEPDIEMLGTMALVDADQRSAANGGRFSAVDIRAGATRAVAASGVVAPRDDLQPVIDAAVARALGNVVDLLDGETDRPAHVKGYMAPSTAALKVELAALFDQLNKPGVTISRPTIATVANAAIGDLPLDEDQADAAAAIAGTHRLVTITGPAGTGKTTMLRVAKRALDVQRRRLVVVAPTKKAASVAAREIGTAGSSLHALLADHGWRWNNDSTGSEHWTRLEPGDTDTTGHIYLGPRRYPLSPGDRIVVDEAGMVDLHTARALAILAAETGAGIAMVGDHLQALPVGHSGAMACMARRSGSVVELTAVHRFHDHEYAALTLRLREPASQADALSVATALDRGGHLHTVADLQQARDVMIEGYFRATAIRHRIALVTATNDEADAINTAIQQRRVERRQLSLHRIAVGMDGQRILEGDVVQTRRNDRTAGVENRALWVVRRIHDAAIDLVSTTDSGDVRTIGTDYAADHLNLAYASTVHGIQGETTDLAIVGPDVDAPGLYVGMTRGRIHNEAIAIPRPGQTAVDVVAATMMRGLPEVTIADARRGARGELGRAARGEAPTPVPESRPGKPPGADRGHSATISAIGVGIGLDR